MKKKVIMLMLAFSVLATGSQAVSAASETENTTVSETATEEAEPDSSSMTPEEWYTYEWHMDASTIFTDITSYDADYVRNSLSNLHNTGYAKVIAGEGDLTDEEKREVVQELHDARVNTPQLNDPEEKRIYLWPDGQVPSITEYTENPGYFYGDAPGFQPFMLECLVEEGVQPKGAVLLAAGGSRNLRCNLEEGIEVARALNEEGYQCFIVNYRIQPYTLEEGGLDIARAVRYVRANAEKYNIDEDKIACAGFSAGGSVITNAIDNFQGDVTAAALVKDYTPDEIDQVSADINAYLSIYANYDRESIDVRDFPATFFAVGGEDGWESVSECFDFVRDSGNRAEIHIFAGAPHGFGAGTDGGGNYFENAVKWPSLADDFMMNLYAKNAAAAEAE